MKTGNNTTVINLAYWMMEYHLQYITCYNEAIEGQEERENLYPWQHNETWPFMSPSLPYSLTWLIHTDERELPMLKSKINSFISEG